MKVLQTIDNHILVFWFTAPEERAWAYLATFVPLTALAIELITLAF